LSQLAQAAASRKIEPEETGAPAVLRQFAELNVKWNMMHLAVFAVVGRPPVPRL
jgi:hypothetical protein